MSKAYEEELVSIAAGDGLPLDGAVIRPVGRASYPVPLVYVHGLSFRFYAPEILRIGRALAGHGHTFVTGNNRVYWLLWPSKRRLGGHSIVVVQPAEHGEGDHASDRRAAPR